MKRRFLNVSISIALVSASPAFAQKEDDLNIGRTSAGQLAVDFDFAQTLELPPIAAILSGWGLDEPGFFSLDVDLPAEGIFMLEPEAELRYEVISFDPAFKGWTQGFAGIFDDPGEQFVLGGPPFDEHPFWHIDSDDPAFDPGQTIWQATGRLIDVGTTNYLPTDPFTLSFTPVPEPASAMLVLIAGLWAIRRRRDRESPLQRLGPPDRAHR